MYFLIKDKKFLEKYDEIWEKVSNIIKNEFSSEPPYNKKNLTQKKTFSVILIDSVYKKYEQFYLKCFQKNIILMILTMQILIKNTLMILMTLKKTIPMIKILIKKITCIYLHLEKTCDQQSSQNARKSFYRNIRNFCFFGLSKFPPEMQKKYSEKI